MVEKCKDDSLEVSGRIGGFSPTDKGRTRGGPRAPGPELRSQPHSSPYLTVPRGVAHSDQESPIDSRSNRHSRTSPTVDETATCAPSGRADGVDAVASASSGEDSTRRSGSGINFAPGIQIALVWLGQNALYVSTYAADAQERALPLITQDPSTHDWWMLLRTADLLAYDDTIGFVFLGLALLAFGTALLLPRVLL